jgi:cyclic pyranopterin phosphate synthase
MSGLTHIDADGQARMVDISTKGDTERVAVAGCLVEMRPETLDLIRTGNAAKGDVLGTARLAGIMAAKRAAELIPLCHPLLPTMIDVTLECSHDRPVVEVIASVKVIGRTGAEMEAMTAAAIAGLTIYDMCKGVDKAICITDLRLHFKSGGKSGTYEAPA